MKRFAALLLLFPTLLWGGGVINPGGGAGGAGDALVANPLSQFAPTTSTQLRGVLSDELGTGAFLCDGATPTSLTLTNATGLPESGVTSLVSDLNLKAPLASPTFTGTVTLPSATTFVNTIGSVAGNDFTARANGPAQITTAQAGNVATFRSSDAVVGSSVAGAANGGQLNLTAGDALRLTSGNANGGSVVISTGSGIGTGASGTMTFTVGPTARWRLDNAGNFIALTDNTNDIGASGATRPRDVYIARNEIITGLTATSAVAPTIASAATIAPTTPIVFVSGTVSVATITPPAPIASGGGQITIIPTGIFTTTTGGNIALASTTVVNKALIMTYDAASTGKWYPSY